MEEAKQEWEEYRKESSKKIKNKIGSKFRPSKEDLKDRGIVPDWENPNLLQENVQKSRTSLKMKIKQRMDPQEAHDRAFIDKDQLLTDKVIHIIYIYIYPCTFHIKNIYPFIYIHRIMMNLRKRKKKKLKT